MSRIVPSEWDGTTLRHRERDRPISLVLHISTGYLRGTSRVRLPASRNHGPRPATTAGPPVHQSPAGLDPYIPLETFAGRAWVRRVYCMFRPSTRSVRAIRYSTGRT